MNCKSLLAMSCLFLACTAAAQTKVFKEVNKDIATQMKVIRQDEALIGYLLFAQLEKANKDSFNYELTILDENLNEIGKVKFREKNLELQSVAFDQDIICLAYLKGEISDLKSASMKEIRKSLQSGDNGVFAQLINLDGVIKNNFSDRVPLTMKPGIEVNKNYRPNIIPGMLTHDIVIKNIPGRGFALLYGASNKNWITMIDFSGNKKWSREVSQADGQVLLTTANEAYVLSQQRKKYHEGGFQLASFNVEDGKSFPVHELKDKKGNELKVIGFENDPLSRKPVLTGVIINQKRGHKSNSVKDLKKGAYDGVFTIEVNGPQSSQIKEKYSYWQDGSKTPDISINGQLSDGKIFPYFSSAIRDYKGNTYFVGSGYTYQARTGAIVSSIVLAPTLVGPIFILGGGTHKSAQKDALLLRQDSAGRLRLDNSISTEATKFYPSKLPFGSYPARNFYTVTNTTTQSNFLIVDEPRWAVIYNLEKKRVVRRVPHKDGNILTYIYPAKEGHILVMEYNKKAKETKLSIEALQ